MFSLMVGLLVVGLLVIVIGYIIMSKSVCNGLQGVKVFMVGVATVVFDAIFMIFGHLFELI